MPYTPPSDPQSGSPIQETWGDAVKAALDYLSGLVDDGAWTNYTPQVDQGVTTNIAKTVNYCRYQKRGRTVVMQFSVTFTASGTAGSSLVVLLPFTTAATNEMSFGTFNLYDNSVNITYVGTIKRNSVATSVIFSSGNAGGGGSGPWGVNPGTAVASGDFVTGEITFESVT